MKPFRVFHYISNTKVDEFYDQLERSKWTSSSVELSGGVPSLAQGKVSGTKAKVDLSLYEKLEKVENHINRTEPPDVVDWGDSVYLRDRMMLWQATLDAASADEPDMVLFAGQSRHGTGVVLGGSAAHLRMKPHDPVRMTDSSFRQVRRAVGLGAKRWLSVGGDDVVQDHVINGGVAGDSMAVDRLLLDHICYISEIAPTSIDWSPMGYCEFLALLVCRPQPQLSEDPTYDEYYDAQRWPHGVLATPLYVQHLGDRVPKEDQLRDPWGKESQFERRRLNRYGWSRAV